MPHILFIIAFVSTGVTDGPRITTQEFANFAKCDHAVQMAKSYNRGHTAPFYAYCVEK